MAILPNSRPSTGWCRGYLTNNCIKEIFDVGVLNFYAVVGEITSTPPSTGAGVREYRHNLYNRYFLKVEVDGFRSFLGYVLKDGYNWM